jgi:hypothetical protein
MSHLTLEALARLVDEPPDVRERAHLAACAACRTELEALVEQCHLLAALPELVPGPDQWPELRSRLRRERLLRERWVVAPGVRRAAAAVVLFVAGGALGYGVRGPADAAPAAPSAGWAAADASPLPVTTPLPGPDAGRDVEAAGELFMAALDRYMASTGVEPADPAARLAVLENIVLTTAEALHEAPADPIISGYHASALAQRNAVLRQLAAGSRQPVF